MVGDDDQALYCFRGVTVENFVQFPERCKTAFGVEPTTIPLDTNYRSRRHIVQFYTDFIGRCDWRNPRGGHFRVTSKQIRAASADAEVAVVTSTLAEPHAVAAEVADPVRRLLEADRVENPNQIAFLFPSLKFPMVARMKDALEARGLRVYAPRAGTFLEVPEAVAMFGLYLRIFGRLARRDFGGEDYHSYHDWLDNAETVAEGLCETDRRLDAYVRDRQAEIERAVQQTGLTRPTVNVIFRRMRPDKKRFFLRNPEGFAGVFIAELRNALADHIAERIEFEIVSEAGP